MRVTDEALAEIVHSGDAIIATQKLIAAELIDARAYIATFDVYINACLEDDEPALEYAAMELMRKRYIERWGVDDGR